MIDAIRLKRSIPKIIIQIFAYMFIVGMTYVFLFPVIYMISVSFRDPLSVYDPGIVWLPRALSTESIRITLVVMNYWTALSTTVIMSLGSTAASLMSCILVGYGLARYRFKGGTLVFILVIVTIIVPPLTTINASFINFRYFDIFGLLKLLAPVTGTDHINLLDTPWPMILPSMFGMGIRSGLYIFIFRQFFAGMPKDLEEAAKVDGCRSFGIFLKVMLPLARPAVITVVLFSFIWNWNDYFLSSTYNMDARTLSGALQGLQSMLTQSGVFAQSHIPPALMRTYLQAGALLMVTPPLILYIFAQRYFTESIENTGIVG